MTATRLFKGRPRRGRDEGASAVETALVLTVVFAVLFGLIEFATAFWQWNTMLFAVEQAGRCAMINNSKATNWWCGTTPLTCASQHSCAETAMQSVLTTASASCLDLANPPAGQFCVSATTDTGPTPPTMTLTASFGFNFLTTSPFTISSTTTVPLD